MTERPLSSGSPDSPTSIGLRVWSSSRAARLSLVGLVAALALYVAVAATAGTDSSGPWGIAFGVAAALTLVAVTLYCGRRRGVFFRMARARSWWLFHVYGGAFFLLFALMHAGFRVPSGALNLLLLLLSAWVAISGAVGVALQKWVPRLLTSGLETEAILERIPELVRSLRDRAEATAEGASVDVREFYERRIAPAMAAPEARLGHFLGAPSAIVARTREFEFLQGFSSAEERTAVESLRSIYRAKLDLDVQYTLQKTTRLWLYGHVPPSVALLVLVAVHVFNVFYY